MTALLLASRLAFYCANAVSLPLGPGSAAMRSRQPAASAFSSIWASIARRIAALEPKVAYTVCTDTPAALLLAAGYRGASDQSWRGGSRS